MEEIRSRVVCFVLFLMGEVTAYLSADENDPVEREKKGDVGEGGSVAKILNLKTSLWGFGTAFCHNLHHTLPRFSSLCNLHLTLHPLAWIDTDLYGALKQHWNKVVSM